MNFCTNIPKMWERGGEEEKEEEAEEEEEEEKKCNLALAGNRTRASRVAGENSTTEPPVPCGKEWSLFYYLNLPATLDIVKDRYSRSKLFKRYKTDTNIPWQQYSQIITR